jgi:hypothetical protein
MIFSAAAGENVQLGMDDFAERIRAERKQDRHCARLFVNAVEGGDADGLLSAVDALNELSVGGWRLAMLGVGRLATTTDEVRAACAAPRPCGGAPAGPRPSSPVWNSQSKVTS